MESETAEPLVPLALIEVNVDPGGLAKHVAAGTINVVAAKDEATSRWARDFVSKLRFAPATDGGEPVAASTLILIRAVQYTADSLPSGLAFEDPWVQSYVAAHKNNGNAPVVNLLRVEKEPGSPAFRYHSTGTDWCLDVFNWTPDSINGGFRREWAPSP